MTVGVHFGALCEPIRKQLARQVRIERKHVAPIRVLQEHADAITRLSLHGLITPAATHRARQRLIKKIAALVAGGRS